MSERHHWVVWEPGGGFDYRTTEESPPDRSKWTGLENADFQEVDRAPEMGEEPDGSGSWLWPLPVLRSGRWAAAKAYREQRINGGCLTPAGAVDSDSESRDLINGAVVMAQIAGAAFSTEWRLSDNSYATLDAAGMIALGMAVGQFVAACYAASFAVSVALDAAADPAAIAAIDITAGYPPS